MKRRDFLKTAAALPALSCLRSHPAFAEETHHAPPYLALQKFIEPGNDEFTGEKKAFEIREALTKAFLNRELPLAEPRPSGAVSWIESLGTVRRAQFCPLPDNIVRYEIASRRDGKLLHRVGHWKVDWKDGKLGALAPLDEHVASADAPFFRDVTAAVFEMTPSFSAQLAKGIPYWRSRLDPASGIDVYGSNGVAAGDIDNDGVDEIYVCQPGGLPNRLYKFKPDGHFEDITEAWGVGILDDTSSALFLDLRNSGRQDLVVLRAGGPVLFLNDGSRFKLREEAFRFATPPSGAFTGMAAADFDRDGKLDLYLCCYIYFQSEAQYTYASPYHDAQNGPPNFLFRNNLNADGSGAFDDCTAETGMNENNNRFSFAPAWCDFNGDGWPDLFVANDFGRKNLYVNDKGHFRDLAATAGVEDIGPGMSASWFDYDRDGKPDLYVANMWTAAGQRVVADKHFAPARNEALKSAYRGHTMGNSLYRNNGDGTFRNVTEQEQVGFGRWAWASGGHDFDNDGESEIFITCGMLTNESETDLSSFFWRQVVAHSPVTAQASAEYEGGWNALNQFVREEYSWNGREPNVLHVRRGDRYYDFSGVSGLDFAEDSRAFAITDFDGDGRPDIILKSRMGPQLRVFQNNCAANNRSIGIRLQGTKSNRDAIGARVDVDGQVKWLEAGSGFLSQHSKQILFGLGESNIAARVNITWPSGLRQEFSNLQAGKTYSITEGAAEIKAQPFRVQSKLPSRPIIADNTLKLEDTWFLEPIPLPEPQRGPGLLVLTERDLGNPQRRDQYAIFRRYLFDWRTDLKLPLVLRLNADGHAVKIYENLQNAHSEPRALAKGQGLPFPGFYIAQPHRDFFKFGAAFLWSGYNEQALPYLQQVLRRTPDNARVLVLVGQIHLQADRLQDAEKYFRDALRANAQSAEAWSGLGDVCQSQNHQQEALTNYEKALAFKSDLLYTLLNAGQASDKLNLQQQAESYYRRALSLDAKSPEALNGLGLALAKLGHPEEAKNLFKQAIGFRPDYSGAINNLGVLYIEEGKVNDAVAAFEYGIRVAPDEDILYLNLGRTYIRLGNIEKARQVMQALLDRKPDSATARHALQELNGR